MKFLSCKICEGELDVIGEEGIHKTVRCRKCGETFGRSRKEPEIVLIKKKRISDDVRKLILWRDARALDWWGDSLIYHVMGALKHPGPADEIPPEHLDGHREFKAMTDEQKYLVIKEVLDITDDEIRRESGDY